jgi:hypothetical protein
MGYSPAEMYEQHDLSSLFNAIRGYWKKQERLRMQTWDQTRFQTFQLINIQLAAKDKLKNYTDLVKFPWDEEPKKVKLTGAQLKEWIGSK